MILCCRQHRLDLRRKTLLMGIVNITDDSFSDDGLLATGENLIAKVEQLQRDGMDIVDIGGESARTNRGPISEQEEMDRMCPAIRQVASRFPDLPISANTWRSKVVGAALDAGAHIVNDISGLADDGNAALAARHGATLVIMHTQGAPKIAHTHVAYLDVLDHMLAFFQSRLALAENVGLTRDRILLDPGLDFAKQQADNLRVMRELAALGRFGCPVLLAASRKTIVGDVLGVPPPQRDPGTAALAVLGILGGARILRVHNVRAMAAVAGMTDAILGSQIRAGSL
jgi:dihydropteroate synthase